MNKIQRDIVEICNKANITGEANQRAIIKKVYESGLDFSECTQGEFLGAVNRAAEEAWEDNLANIDEVVGIESTILDMHSDGDIDGAYQLIFDTPFLREELEGNDYTASELVDVIKLRR